MVFAVLAFWFAFFNLFERDKNKKFFFIGSIVLLLIAAVDFISEIFLAANLKTFYGIINNRCFEYFSPITLIFSFLKGIVFQYLFRNPGEVTKNIRIFYGVFWYVCTILELGFTFMFSFFTFRFHSWRKNVLFNRFIFMKNEDRWNDVFEDGTDTKIKNVINELSEEDRGINEMYFNFYEGNTDYLFSADEVGLFYKVEFRKIKSAVQKAFNLTRKIK